MANDVIEKVLLTRRQALALGASAALASALPRSAFAEDQKVTLWHGWTGADNTTALNGVIDTFNKSGKGVTVEPTGYDWDTLFSKWVVSSAGGRARRVRSRSETLAIVARVGAQHA